MEIKISNLDIVRVKTSEYNGKTYYYVICLNDKGYTFSLPCSENFYNACVEKLRSKNLTSVCDVLGKVTFYQDKTKVYIL